MLTSDPKLPQLYGSDAGEFVSVSFYRRFQERFYNLWRELALLVNRLVQGPSGATDNQVARFSGTTGALVKASTQSWSSVQNLMLSHWYALAFPTLKAKAHHEPFAHSQQL